MRLCNETSILVFQRVSIVPYTPATPGVRALDNCMFAKEGVFILASASLTGILLGWLALRLDNAFSLPVWILALLIVGFTFFFFRDPVRTPPDGAVRMLLAPADGKVISIDEVDEPLYRKERSLKMSIFLSPLNVHINRIPADGLIEYVRYVPGEYLVAWHPKASEKNERSEIGLRHPSGIKIVFKQIAGAVARRIVFHLEEGDTVEAGDRFGLVKFGSRMDIIVPLDTKFDVSVGDPVRAGETILGLLSSVSADEESDSVVEGDIP